MQHCNLAVLDEISQLLHFNKKENCVFISYKKEDAQAAQAIGNFLINAVGIDIYLDTNDFELEEAVSEENDQKIVNSIRKGLSHSTHLLCLISDKTRLSWWVPYEIGVAETNGLDIASLKLKNIDDFPSYLKIRKTLYNTDQFLRYVSEITPLAVYFSESNYRNLSACNLTEITQFID